MKTNTEKKFINVPMDKNKFNDFQNKVDVLHSFFQNSDEPMKIDKAEIIRRLIAKFVKMPSIIFKELKGK